MPSTICTRQMPMSSSLPSQNSSLKRSGTPSTALIPIASPSRTSNRLPGVPCSPSHRHSPLRMPLKAHPNGHGAILPQSEGHGEDGGASGTRMPDCRLKSDGRGMVQYIVRHFSLNKWLSRSSAGSLSILQSLPSLDNNSNRTSRPVGETANSPSMTNNTL